jgi:hypothetical protein
MDYATLLYFQAFLGGFGLKKWWRNFSMNLQKMQQPVCCTVTEIGDNRSDLKIYY